MSTFLDLEPATAAHRALPSPASGTPKARWRLSVFALVAGGSGTWLLVRQRRSGRWNLPGGRVKAGESIPAALRREFYEEVGVPLVGSPRLQAVIEQPERARIFLYFRAAGNFFHQANYGRHDEISESACFPPADFPADRCQALRLWLDARSRPCLRGVQWHSARPIVTGATHLRRPKS